MFLAKLLNMPKKIKYDKIEFKTGDLFKSWPNKKFDIMISDVSSLNQSVAEKSPWYQGIDSNCGKDGLKYVKKIIKKLNHYLKKDGVFIIPIISILLKKLIEYIGHYIGTYMQKNEER